MVVWQAGALGKFSVAERCNAKQEGGWGVRTCLDACVCVCASKWDCERKCVLEFIVHMCECTLNESIIVCMSNCMHVKFTACEQYSCECVDGSVWHEYCTVLHACELHIVKSMNAKTYSSCFEHLWALGHALLGVTCS